MDTLPSVEGPNSVGGDNVWFNGADGERQAIRSTAAIPKLRTR
jgi:hypothetical protein